jgi:hypothetical protein
MARKINNSRTLGQSGTPATGGDMLKTRGDGTMVWEAVDGTEYVYIPPITRGVFGDLTVGRNYFGACSGG